MSHKITTYELTSAISPCRKWREKKKRNNNFYALKTRSPEYHVIGT